MGCIVPLADDEVARAQYGAAGMFATSPGDTVAKTSKSAERFGGHSRMIGLVGAAAVAMVIYWRVKR